MADEAIKSLAVKLALENGSFDKGIADLKQSLNVVNSGFKASVAGVKDWGANIDALKNNASALGDKITLQKQIVGKYAEELGKSKKALDDNSAKMLDIKDNLDKTTAAYKDSVTATGKNSDETKQLKVQLDSLTDQYTKSEKVVINNKTSLNKLTTEYNNAKGEVNKLESELEETTAAIDKQAKRFQNLSTHIKATAGHIGNGLVSGMKIGAGAIAGIGGAAVLGIGSLLTKSIQLSGQLEQNMGGSEAVFKKYAGNMQDAAKKAFSNMGLATSDYLASANKMGALFQGSGFSIKDSADMSASAMQRAADVASIMGIDTSMAMESIAGAAKGNFTMMDNLGVSMTDTSIKAYALEKGIKTAGTTMTQQEKIGIAMKMFLDKTAYAAGNYAKENETLAGSFGTAKSALTNFLDGSGSVKDLVSSFTGFGKIVVKNITEMLPELVKGVSEIIKGLMPEIPKLINQMMPAIKDGMNVVIRGIALMLPQLAEVVFDLLGSIAQMLIDNAPLLIDALVKTVSAIVAGYSAMVPKLLELAVVLIKELAKGLVTAIPEMLKAAVQLISGLVTYLLNPENLSTLLKAALDIVVAIVKGLVEAIPQLIDAAIQLIMSLVDFILDPKNIGMLLKAAWDIVVALSKGLIKAAPQIIVGVVEVVAQVFTSLGEALSPLGKWFGDKFGEAWTAIKGAFSNVGEFFGGVWDTIKSKFTSIGSSIGNAMGGAFKSAVNSVINFAEKTINGFISDINWAIKVINKIPGVEINPLKQIDIPPMSIGTRYLPKDTLVNAHAGEMIVPRSENPYANSGGRVLPGGAVFNITVGTLVGSDGMNEFAGIISQRMAGNLALNGG